MKKCHEAYEKHDSEELILRDHMAADRTMLANERTVLAYARTALTAAVAGLTVIRFFPEWYYQVIGWLFMAIGIAVSVTGIMSCRRERKYLEKFMK